LLIWRAMGSSMAAIWRVPSSSEGLTSLNLFA
jgi:hypothetical protein